jgi:Domain of unknown function (DUF4389)
MSPGRVIMAVIGACLGLLAVGMLAAGGGLLWAYGTQRTADGFFTTPTATLSTGTYALTSAEIDLGARPGDWFPSGQLATVRLEAESDDGTPVFVGIGPEDDVAAYLSGVGFAEVDRIGLDPDNVTYRTTEGGAPPGPPSDEDFWSESVEGAGTQTLTWELEAGEWNAVIMNADGSAGVSVDVAAGARVGILVPIAIGLIIGGLIFGMIAAVLLVFAVRQPAGAVTPAPAGTAVAAGITGGYGNYPVRVEGELDPGVSRWQWLFKWLLVIPHIFVLAFLWIGFALLTFVAGFAILFTGRYPRALFDFNVGVLRWSWRVTFYSYGVLGTDRYPPFTLAETDYPTGFDVEYPEQLSRGLVLIKWWLLAIPHYLIVGLFTSGLVWWTTDIGEDGDAVLKSGGGLISILVLIAGLILLFSGRYPQGLFDLIMGLQRWVFRVVAYAALMRDEYPPFRLDIGGPEPDVMTPPALTAPPTGPPESDVT